VAHEEAQSGGPRRHVALLVWQAVRNAVIHPVPIPILAGLLFAQTGWAIPAVVDTPLMLLGQAFGPLALVMVGVTLAQNRIGPHLRGAMGLALVKNLLPAHGRERVFVRPALPGEAGADHRQRGGIYPAGPGDGIGRDGLCGLALRLT